MVDVNIVLRYFDAGWPVLPLPARSKEPVPAGTTGYEGVDLTRDELLVVDWSGNIAVRMPATVIGLDIDVYHHGNVTLDELRGKLGALPPTWVTHSNRGDGSGIGFFLVPAGLTWLHSLPGIEVIQRHHRYALVWPSIHPEERRYDWRDEQEGDDDLFDDSVPEVDALPDLPWSWVEFLSRADRQTATKAVSGTTRTEFLSAHQQADAPGYFTSKVVGEQFTEKVQAGHSRHDSMQHTLTFAMECVRAGLVSGDQAYIELGAAWAQALAGEPRRAVLTGSRPTEFEAMLRHAVGKVVDRPQAEFDAMHDEVAGVRMNVVAAAVPVVGDYQPEQPELPRPIDWTAFVNRQTTPRAWLVDRFWPWGRALAVYADAKQGKSEFALWLACMAALGIEPWTGTQGDPIEVGYFDFEMTEDDLEERLTDFDFDPLLLEHLHYWQLPSLHHFDTNDGGLEVESLAAEFGLQAVVIDTLMRTVEGEENKADTIHNFAKFTGGRLKAMGTGVLRLDHIGNENVNRARGTSAKRGDVDVSWSQKRTQSGIVLDCTGSSRLSWVGPRLELDRTVVNDIVSYKLPVQIGWTAAASQKAKELDRLNVPPDATRRAAVDALKAAGLKAGRTTTLDEALRYRREMADTRQTESGTKPGTKPNPGSDGNQEPNGNQATDPF